MQQAVVMLGDQIVSLQWQLHMKCDWNQSSFCVTPVPYNETLFPWEKVKRHLFNHRNLTEEILDLQMKIQDTFQKELHRLSSEGIMKGIADGISNLKPYPSFAGGFWHLSWVATVSNYPFLYFVFSLPTTASCLATEQ